MRGRANGSARGYTMMEVMISMALLAIGVTGVIGLQKTTAVVNRDAKNLSLANHIAATWLERLRLDGAVWTHNNSVTPPAGTWMDQGVNAGTPGTWFVPNANAAYFAKPGADPLGGDTDAGTDVFCTHVRLSWIYGPPTSVPSPTPNLLRADVRTFWYRAGFEQAAGACAAAMNDFTDPATAGKYHIVYATTGINAP